MIKTSQKITTTILYGTTQISPIKYTVKKRTKIIRKWWRWLDTYETEYYIETDYSILSGFKSYKDALLTLIRSGIKFNEIEIAE